MKKISIICLFVMLFSSCSKVPAVTNITSTDNSGKYEGPSNLKSTSSGSAPVSIPYNMIIDISKGDKSDEIKILFGNWLTVATLTGTNSSLSQLLLRGLYPQLDLESLAVTK